MPGEGESLSQFVEAAVRACVPQRKSQGEFIARGLASLADARRSGEYVDAGEVMHRLKGKLAAAKKQQAHLPSRATAPSFLF